MDDLNSSDIEFEPPPPNPFLNAGKDSILAMREYAIEDRVESKKQAKQLGFVKGTGRTQYLHALWYNRFCSFREHTLRVEYGTFSERVTCLSLVKLTVGPLIVPIWPQTASRSNASLAPLYHTSSPERIKYLHIAG
jgi:hypothetical protein